MTPRQPPSHPRRSTATFGLAALLLILAVAAGQKAGRGALAQVPSFEEQVSVSWVLVPVVVRAGDRYVRSLGRESFHLRVGGEEVPVASFEPRSDAPLSIVWLQDLSGSMDNGGKLEASREALGYFLDRAREEDRFALGTFSGGEVLLEVPFTAETTTLREALGAWEGWGTTALYDAVAWVPEITAAGRQRKRAVILVTDGADNASEASPAQARLLVRDARLPVYVLGLLAGNPLALTDDGEKVYRYAHLLNQLARSSGGRFFRVRDVDDIRSAAAGIMDELRNQYVLGFPAAEGPRRYRRIEVEVDGRSESDLVHRLGYRGGPPAPALAGGGP